MRDATFFYFKANRFGPKPRDFQHRLEIAVDLPQKTESAKKLPLPWFLIEPTAHPPGESNPRLQKKSIRFIFELLCLLAAIPIGEFRFKVTSHRRA
ncbi:MAG: hypothetical protein WCH99_02575 [Verrucomicrobiota bacterium]